MQGLIQQISPGPWKTRIKYLAIKLNAILDVATLIKLNLALIVMNTRQQLANWHVLCLSWFG